MNFDERVWEACKHIPKGRVTTYGEIAKALDSKAYRAVGNALNRNPYAPQVPCHRVVNSDGRIGGFAGGTQKKISLLKKEGVEVKDNKIVEFQRRLFRF